MLARQGFPGVAIARACLPNELGLSHCSSERIH
jgi:hypothetical protein